MRNGTPAQVPMASHQRGSPDRSSRSTRYQVSAQNAKSRVVVVNRWLAARYSPQQAVASAAISWAGLPPPSSLLMAAVR